MGRAPTRHVIAGGLGLLAGAATLCVILWALRGQSYVGAIWIVHQCAGLLDGRRIIDDVTWVCEALLAPLAYDLATFEASLSTYRDYAAGVWLTAMAALILLTRRVLGDSVLALAALFASGLALTLSWWVGYADAVTALILAGLYLAMRAGRLVWLFALGAIAGVNHFPAGVFGFAVIVAVLAPMTISGAARALAGGVGITVGAACVQLYLASVYGPGLGKIDFVARAAPQIIPTLTTHPLAIALSPLRAITLLLVFAPMHVWPRLALGLAIVFTAGALALDQSRIMAVVGFPLAVFVLETFRTGASARAWMTPVQARLFAAGLIAASLAAPPLHLWDGRVYDFAPHAPPVFAWPPAPH